MSSNTAGARVCFTSRVRADRLDEYRVAHAAVWPEMLRALRDTGWRDYHLFLRDDGLLVGILVTDDYEAAQRGMAATEVNARWQAAMSGFFVDEGNPDDGFVLLDEVFHLEAQLAALPDDAESGDL
ncbi:L-rhamnose mutarotase [Promicromonospora sp. NPDC059942]|uniref:L-rhamnose mutarotase n=1 Tax=Promicromonospora sp. NPDC059942 TaxID=3347009 RepID=UPI003659A11B